MAKRNQNAATESKNEAAKGAENTAPKTAEVISIQDAIEAALRKATGPASISDAEKREKAKDAEREKDWTAKKVAIAELELEAVKREAANFLKDFKKAEPTLDKARELEGTMSQHTVNLARMACTRAYTRDGRLAVYDRLCGIMQGEILAATNPPTKDASNMLYSNTARLRMTASGTRWLTYQSTVRSALKESGVDFLAKETDDKGNPVVDDNGYHVFVIKTFYDARNAVTEARNKKAEANRGAVGTPETDAANGGATPDQGSKQQKALQMQGGMLQQERVHSAVSRLLGTLTDEKWPVRPNGELVSEVARAINACTKAIDIALSRFRSDQENGIRGTEAEAELPDAEPREDMEENEGDEATGAAVGQ